MNILPFLMGASRELWTPAALGSALAFWFDAADDATFTLVGSDVAVWGDKSGNGRDASEATNRPVRNSTLNGLSVVTGTNLGRLSTSSVTWPDGGYTFFGIAELDDAGSYPVLASGGKLDFRGVSTSARMSFVNNDTNTGAGENGGSTSGFGPSLLSAWTIICATLSAADAWDIRGNGASYDSRTSAIDPSATDSLDIFHRSGSLFWDGKSAEKVICFEKIADADVERLEGYGAWKWGLEGNLDAGHPYKNDPPYL